MEDAPKWWWSRKRKDAYWLRELAAPEVPAADNSTDEERDAVRMYSSSDEDDLELERLAQEYSDELDEEFKTEPKWWWSHRRKERHALHKARNEASNSLDEMARKLSSVDVETARQLMDEEAELWSMAASVTDDELSVPVMKPKWWWSRERQLLQAAKAGDAERACAVLVKGHVDVDVCDDEHYTPLHWACICGHVGLVDLLLQANASTSALDKDGWTPLHIASTEGHLEVVGMLLQAGADPNAISTNRRTAFHEACHWRQSGVVRTLFAFGAELHAKDNDGLEPMHLALLPDEFTADTTFSAAETLGWLVSFGATWDATCDELIASSKTSHDAPSLRACVLIWTQERIEGLPLTDIPVEMIKRDPASVQAYVASLKSSIEVVLRRKICVVGPSCAGKTSFIKSITALAPQLEHIDDRTIGIDQFRLRFHEWIASLERNKIHDVTFWDFAGQDAYQVAHSLFFSPRTLFLVCIDLEAFTVAYLQASIMSNVPKQETQLMGEFIERTVLRWVRLILARQPDAEFVFVATKEDLLTDNKVTEALLKNALAATLREVEGVVLRMKKKQLKKTDESSVAATNQTTGAATSVLFISCTSPASIQIARNTIEALIIQSKRSFQMPDDYSEALRAIVAMRKDAATTHNITDRLHRVFAKVEDLPAALHIEADECKIILQTLHDLGDVLWYEDLGVELFQNTVILDPLLLIDFIRQVINHKQTGQIMPHADLKAKPYWMGLQDKTQMEAMKQVLQKFHLVYPADEDHSMAWDSDLIVPAYWQTKTPASWLFLGDILRLNKTTSCKNEARRLHWEYHFEFGLPSTLFDHLVVASVSPYVQFDAGPDWILYEEKGIAACRLLVGRDRVTLHRTIHVEAVVASSATADQTDKLWASFQQLYGAFVAVMKEHPGLVVSSFAWDDKRNKIGLARLFKATTASVKSVSWMPPVEAWHRLKEHAQVPAA